VTQVSDEVYRRMPEAVEFQSQGASCKEESGTCPTISRQDDNGLAAWSETIPMIQILAPATEPRVGDQSAKVQ
jgi:hypothetical protein